MPYVSGYRVDQLYAQLWHVGVAILAGFTPPDAADHDVAAADGAPDMVTLANRAAEHKDPHAIKFAEACLREYWLRPNPIYLLEAQNGIER